MLVYSSRKKKKKNELDKSVGNCLVIGTGVLDGYAHNDSEQWRTVVGGSVFVNFANCHHFFPSRFKHFWEIQNRIMQNIHKQNISRYILSETIIIFGGRSNRVRNRAKRHNKFKNTQIKYTTVRRSSFHSESKLVKIQNVLF